jgi:hypothetical protein
MTKRHFTEDEVAWITTYPRTINSANISVECPACRRLHKLQISLAPAKPLRDGYARFPGNNLLQCCGKSFEMSHIRNDIEWTYGWPKY